MVFGAIVAHVLKFITVQTVCLSLVWVLRKKDGEGTTPCTNNRLFGVWYETFFVPFFVGNCLVKLVVPCCNSLGAFEPVFSEKSASARTSIHAFLTNLLERAQALWVLATASEKLIIKSAKTSKSVIRSAMITRKTVGAFFGSILY